VKSFENLTKKLSKELPAHKKEKIKIIETFKILFTKVNAFNFLINLSDNDLTLNYITQILIFSSKLKNTMILELYFG
jgi:hypothetical protein